MSEHEEAVAWIRARVHAAAAKPGSACPQTLTWTKVRALLAAYDAVREELLEARERIEMLEADAQLVLRALKYCRGIDGHDLEKMIDTYREDCT